MTELIKSSCFYISCGMRDGLLGWLLLGDWTLGSNITMHKTQIQMDQRPQHKASHTEPHRRESGKYTWTHWHRRPLPKYNPSSTDTERNNKLDLLKLRSFYKAKDTVNKAKRQPTEWEKIFTNPTSDRSDLQNIQRTQEIGHQRNK